MRAFSIRTMALVGALVGLLGSTGRADSNVAADVERYLETSDAAAHATSDDLYATLWGEDPNRWYAEAGVWWGRLRGPIGFEGDTRIDVADVFGFDDREGIPYLRLGVRLWRLEFFLEGWWMGQSGKRVVEQEFEINGEVFEVGDVIHTRLTLSTYRIGAGFDFWRDDAITVTGLINATLISTTGSVETESQSKRAHWDAWLPVPAIGVNLSGNPWKKLIYEFELSWVGFSKGIFSFASWDLRLSVGWQFTDWAYARAGFRHMTIEGELGDIDVDVYIEGFYLEFGVAF